ncbi:MAG: hypothetical protein NZ518_10385 [Dehalococcoidia bacterium]|nr:hypothetical protein [Dehalococcoidia bacterium]
MNIGVISPPSCPTCGAAMIEIQRKPVKWHCAADGWFARLEPGFLAKQVISKRDRFTFEGGEVGTRFQHKPIRTNPHLRYLFYQHPEDGAPDA